MQKIILHTVHNNLNSDYGLPICSSSPSKVT